MPPEASRPDLDALPDGIVIAGPARRVEHVNLVAARMLDLEPAAAAGRPLEEVLRLTDRRGTTWTEDNRPYDGIEIRTGIPEQSWILPDGQEVLVTAALSRARPLGPVTGVALCLRSGRGRARLDRDRADLVATLAHELRSPLTGVKGFVQAILNRWDLLTDDQKRLMLTTVSADSERLSRLITEVLDVARMDSGRLTVAPRASSAVVLTERVVASVSAGTGRHLELEVADGLPEAWLDPDRFTQVVTNVVENAVRHGAGTVRILVRPGLLGGRIPAVALDVDDQGRGIPEELRARVFTKFWKHGDNAGSGLGMYLVGGLVRAHAGAVEIGAAPGGGARVTLVWPAVDPGDREVGESIGR